MKLKEDAGLQDEVKKFNTMPLHLSAFVLTNSKRIVKKFLHVIDGFHKNNLYYEDTDSMYIEIKTLGRFIDEAGSVGKNCLQGKNDYKPRDNWYGLFLALEKKYCFTINKPGITDEQKLPKVLQL